MNFFIAGVVSLESMEYNEDENEIGADIQKAESLATSFNSGSNSEPLPGPQRTPDEESLGLPGSYTTK